MALVTLMLGALLACSPESSDVVRRGTTEGSVSPEDSAPPQGSSSGSDARPVVLFLGTSLTAGLGLESQDHAYPAKIQERIDAAAFSFRVLNAGVSGDTSAGGLRRLEWLLEEPVSVLVLELGANDGLRGLGVDQLRANLQSAVDLARQRDPDIAIVIAGMEAPTNMGERYTSAFRGVFGDVARANDAALIPFLLEGVGGLVEMNQDDRIHPTSEGHERIAGTVWSVLRPILESRAGSTSVGSGSGTP